MKDRLRRSAAAVLAVLALGGAAAAAQEEGAPPGAETPQPLPDPTAARIKYLHDRLRITPAQEEAWHGVAEAMADNAKAIAPLLHERLKSAQSGDAVAMLDAYEKLGEAQLAAVKRFVAAFDALYPRLTPEQRKIADTLFRLGPLSMVGAIPLTPEERLMPPEPVYAGAPTGVPPPVAPAYPVYPPYPFYPAYPAYPPYAAYGWPWLLGPPLGFAGRGVVFLGHPFHHHVHPGPHHVEGGHHR